jgi:hypothetical protein
MARMNGCNAQFENHEESPRKEPCNPWDFCRNQLSKGGVNKDLGGGAKSGSGGSVKAGGAAQGKHHHMPKGK